MSSTVLPAPPADRRPPPDVALAALSDRDLAALSDHDLLAGCVSDQVWENRLAAQRAARLEEFRGRREAEQQVAERLRVTRTLQREFPGSGSCAGSARWTPTGPGWWSTPPSRSWTGPSS